MQISAPGSASPSSCPFEDEDDDTVAEPVLRNLSDNFSPSFSLANDQGGWQSHDATETSGDNAADRRDWTLPVYTQPQMNRSFGGFFVNGIVCHNYNDAKRALSGV